MADGKNPKKVSVSLGDTPGARFHLERDGNDYALVNDQDKSKTVFAPDQIVTLTGEGRGATIDVPRDIAEKDKPAFRLSAENSSLIVIDGPHEALVPLDVGSDQHYQIERYRDSDGVSKYAIIDTKDLSKPAILGKKQTLELTGNGKSVSLAIPKNVGLEEDDPKPRIRINTENKPEISGPHEIVNMDTRIGMNAGRENETALAAASAPSQEAFDAHLARGLDPQVAYALAEMQQKGSYPAPVAEADHNSIEMPKIPGGGGSRFRV